MLGKAEKFKDQVDLIIAAFSLFLWLPQTVHTPAQGETDISDIYRCDLAESRVADTEQGRDIQHVREGKRF